MARYPTLIVALALAGAARGQAIERNLPPAPAPGAPAIATPAQPLAGENDATPIGPALTAIVVLGPADPLAPTPPPGVDLTRAPRLDRPKSRARLAHFLGRPISRKLIGEITAAIALDYRNAGLPLVSVSTPPQEITAGVLRVRVIEFRLGSKTAPGARHPARILAGVRAAPGQPIDIDQLTQDLDWLNRTPFRHTEAAFTPGADTGGTNLVLTTTQSRPIAGYIGYADSGSPLTGTDRYFAGLSVALPLPTDSWAAWQVTSSPNHLLWKAPAGPTYLSHAGRFVIGVGPRSDLEGTVSFIATDTPTPGTDGLFATLGTTYEASLAWRSALSNFFSHLPGEGALGVEVRRQVSATRFAGFEVFATREDIFQITASYAGTESDAFGHTGGEITLHISPGGVDRYNTDAAFAAAQPGRSPDSAYAYVSADLTRDTPLGGGFSWRLALIGQYASGPLPVTEQIGLGGSGLVRAYTLDDGAFDAGLIARDEIHFPAISVIPRGVADALGPYVFVDAGFGKSYAVRGPRGAASTGFGGQWRIGPQIALDLDAAWALAGEGATRPGGMRLESRVSLGF